MNNCSNCNHYRFKSNDVPIEPSDSEWFYTHAYCNHFQKHFKLGPTILKPGERGHECPFWKPKI